MSTEITLAPCAFCPDTGENVSIETEGNDHFASCMGCGAAGPRCESVEDAAKRWNRRNSPAPYERRNGLLVSIDQARGTVAVVAEMLCTQGLDEKSNAMEAHAWSALNLAVDELQRIRVEAASIMDI